MTLMIVDGNSILNRAYFGIRPLSAPDGTPTNAIYGFLTILNRLYKEYKPDSLCIAFDVHAPTFRHKKFDFYKAQRKPMPDDLCAQMPVLKDILGKMGISIVELEGYEADDVLGTISKKCHNDGINCIVVTGDRDSLQLINDSTSVCLVRTNDNTLYDEATFINEYGFEPIKLIDLKSLQGDSSDNIPGVPGIGEKTASDLIKRYGSLDNILKDIDSLEVKDNVKKKLTEGKHSALDSFWLATINCESPLNVDLNDYLWNKNYKEGLYSALNKLGLKRIIQSWDIIDDAGVKAMAEDEDSSEDIIPDGLTVTSDLKSLYKNGFSGDAFDTIIAQYCINPGVKEYSSDVSYSKLAKKIEDDGLHKIYYDIELPLTKVLADMELTGIYVDKQSLADLSADLSDLLEVLSQNIYFKAGREFNINSPKQLGEILFDELKLPDKKKRSTAADILESLRPYNTIIDDILDYRELSKLKNTYTDGLQDYIQDDGRIHTTFQQTVTATGRLSSTDPNLQNIPIRKELGSKLRKMFIASPGKVLVDADYSQIELRLLAHIANDQAMIDAFNSGEDFHKVTAAKVFNLPLDKVTSVERSRAKAVNFGIVYGMSAFSLANDIHVSNAQAKAYMDEYFEEFSGVAKYMKDVVAKAKEDGYVTTLFGRRRYIPELKSSNFNLRSFGERVALNMPIQGTAADIIKIAMINAYRDIEKYGAKLVLQVHDELIIECDEAVQNEVKDTLKTSMESAVDLLVPLLVEVGSGSSWAEAH